MKTIQGRITLILVITLLLITANGLISLYYLSQISGDITQITEKDLTAQKSAEDMKSALQDLKKEVHIFLYALKKGGEMPFDLTASVGEFEKKVKEHKEIVISKDNIERLELILQYIEQFKSDVGDIKFTETQPTTTTEIRNFEKNLISVTEKMENTVGDIISSRSLQIEQRKKEIDILLSTSQRNMLVFLFISLGTGIFVMVMAPRSVTLPFKRYVSAIRDVEDLNFEKHLPVTSQDEVGELGKAINHLIDRFRTFDEIKRKRIQFEKGKVRVLANMVDLGVLMASIEGEIVLMNTQLSKILDLDLEDYMGKDINSLLLPDELKEMIAETVKTREKINSRMMILNYKPKNETQIKSIEVLVDVGLVRNYQGKVVNIIITFEDITNPTGSSVFKRISIAE